MDSNHDLQSQNLTCYRCTTGKYEVEIKGLEPLTNTV